MNQKMIFVPLIGQVVLTAIVFFRMYYSRVAEMRSKRIHPQKIATHAGTQQHLSDSIKISDNLSNQFELPVLFYVACLALYVTGTVSVIFMVLACAFVALRVVHSMIHCSYNNVMHRLYAFASSSFVLWAMWVLFAYKLISL